MNAFNQILPAGHAARRNNPAFSAHSKNPGSTSAAPYLSYALFIDTLQGQTALAQHDARELPLTYKSEREAQRAIARIGIRKLRKFLGGEMDFDDALSVDEYYLPVWTEPDGVICTQDGKRFGGRREQESQ